MGTFYVVTAEGVLLVTSEWRPGSALTMHETAPPHTKGDPAQNLNNTKVEKHWFRAHI